VASLQFDNISCYFDLQVPNCTLLSFMSSCVSTKHLSMAFAVTELSFLLQCRPAAITHFSKHLQRCCFRSD